MNVLQEVIAPLGHTIIALSSAPDVGVESLDWAEYLNEVSGPIEQRPTILVVPFSNINDAEIFAEQAPVKTNYRFVAACYNGATAQEPEIAASVAAALADSNDPALPFNGVNLLGLKPVEDEVKLFSNITCLF